ncbi:TetR/AcrR family transcriptional regulator [Aminobacter anthyllidis]|uniref:TetR/AcrR family transcriptional regulator n=1 Tax=Aminobacter anthyllidis TaxID=1035067 RepID=UPI0024544F7D|nr:TetR/AcrR family transcriptional regulator [Aminobacter anthyllidis]MDH4987961.1 TetR/AcrR family transcriptional regulator [Aminobacter anthyllidis]
MSIEADSARKSIGAKRSLESAEAILEAAEAVLIENGYSGFSIEAVARRARAGKPTIYRWWPSKTALLLEVYQRQKRDITYPDTGDIEEDLFIFAKSLFSQWRDTPSGNIFRSLVAEAQQDPAAAEALAEYARGRRAHTGKLIERAKARGEVAADVDPSQVADMVSSYAWVHLLTGRLDEDEAMLRQAIRHIVHGIAVRG